LPARSFSGDRGMLEREHAQLRAEMLERQHARTPRRIALLICSVVGVAVAAGVWAITWVPDAWAPLSVSLGKDDRFLASVATRPEQPNSKGRYLPTKGRCGNVRARKNQRVRPVRANRPPLPPR
jgi:hypothetical protein